MYSSNSFHYYICPYFVSTQNRSEKEENSMLQSARALHPAVVKVRGMQEAEPGLEPHLSGT